jgi:hypothetical protein
LSRVVVVVPDVHAAAAAVVPQEPVQARSVIRERTVEQQARWETTTTAAVAVVVPVARVALAALRVLASRFPVVA